MKQRTRIKPIGIGVYLNRRTKASREQVAGIFRFAGEHPEWELHLFTRPDTPAEMRRMTAAFVPDGIISGHPAIVDAFNRRLGRRIPSVLIDYADARPKIPAALVLCNDHEIGARAADVFLKRGYTSFAFAGIMDGSGGSDAVNSKNRENGFRRALRKAGCDCAVYAEKLNRNALHYQDTARLKAWLRNLPKPCALMVSSDFLGQSIMTACRKAKIALPDQIAVIGVDNEVSVCESATPKLSSIEPDFSGGGYLAAEMLNRMLVRGARSARPPRATYGILRIEERMSTQNVAGPHLRVAKAREIVRAEAFNGIRAAEIADRLGISTRMLEMTFQKTLGYTLREELLRVRLAEAEHILRTTTKPLGEIAASCGFRTLSALKAIFRKRHGQSLRNYRTRRTKA